MRKIIIFCQWVCALVLFLCFGFQVFAKKVSLTYLDYQRDITVVIRYDKKEPNIQLTAPDGKKYQNDGDYSKIERTNHTSYYYIEDAAQGNWYIDYTEEIGTDVIVDVVNWHQEPTINNFIMSAKETGSVSVSADISCGKDISYDYYLYAVLLNENGAENAAKEISRGSATTNNKLEVEAFTDSLPDGKNYHIKLEAVITYEDEIEATTSVISDKSFSVSGHIATGSKEEFTTILNLTDGTLHIDWNGITDSYEKCVVAMSRGEETNSPEFFETYENREEENILDLNVDLEEQTPITVTISLMSDGKVTSQYERIIVVDNGVSCSINTDSFTNSQMVEVAYDTGDKELQASLQVGEKTESLLLKDAGTFSVKLEDMATSDIFFRYWWETGSCYEISSRISSDTTPPLIHLYGVSDTVTVSESKIYISGQTEAGVTVEVNESPVSVGKDGSFEVCVALSKGENDILFIATDSAGNKTSNAIKVLRTTGKTSIKNLLKSFPWKDLILPVIIALVWLGIQVVASFAAKKRQYNKKKMAFFSTILFLVFGIAGCCIWMGYYALKYRELSEKISGQSLIEVLKNASVAGITIVLNERTEYLYKMRIPFAVAICFLLLFIILLALKKFLKNISDNMKEAKQRRTAEKKIKKNQKKGQRKGTTRIVFCPGCGARYEIRAGEKMFCGVCGSKIE